jgi:linoleate 8R-lipoxygenase / 9,12-octadecadienoate 8-hydroperoxide 8R-isomerase
MQPGALPDPGVIFDSIMTRKHREPHPNKISGVLFYLASIIIHDLFRTDHQNLYNSKTSSYLDLAPLYGSNMEEQKKMRMRKDGKLKPDCFSEVRLLSFPPGVGCLLLMFNRFHNRVVEKLATINQGNRFKRPKGDWPTGDPESDNYPDSWRQLDENLFQTGRLITCGLYINIVLGDYVRTILNLNKTDSNWALDPRADIPSVPVAVGNQVSAEFNLVYRWHSAISERDEAWTLNFWKNTFKEQDPQTGQEKVLDPETIPWHKFVLIASKVEDELQAMDPEDRPFSGLTKVNGKFKDDDLVEILASSIEDCANSFGANRVPSVMRVIEILGIEQARAWNVASLNEFRKYFGLEPHATFESINSDPFVANQLRHLYEHPDHVELYPGLVSEEPKIPLVPGSGLAPSFTVSRAVLSDAVALVRGDRFYTVDYHPKKLTNWGYSDVASDVHIDNGCVFYKLVLNTFPEHFKSNSVYAHYPMTVPSEMQTVLRNLEREKGYSYERPSRMPKTHIVSTYAAATEVLANANLFRVSITEETAFFFGNHANLFAGEYSKESCFRKSMQEAPHADGKWDAEVRASFERITTQLLQKKAYQLAGKNQVDIIRDIGNLAPVHFAAEMFALPLKTEERPLGIFTEHELYVIVVSIFVSVYFDPDPASSIFLRQNSKDAAKTLGELVQANITEIGVSGGFSRLTGAIFPQGTPLQDCGVAAIKRLLKGGISTDEVAWRHILGDIGGLTANLGQLFAQVFEFYMTEGKEHMPAIRDLANNESDEAFQKLMRYVLEGCRIAGEAGVSRQVDRSCEVKSTIPLRVSKGDRILINLCAASRDPAQFPNPDKVLLDRPLESYITLTAGPLTALGDGMSQVALTAMFKVIGKLEDLQPVPGAQGKVNKILARFPGEGEGPLGPWFHQYLAVKQDSLWPSPQSKPFKLWLESANSFQLFGSTGSNLVLFHFDSC